MMMQALSRDNVADLCRQVIDSAEKLGQFASIATRHVESNAQQRYG